jgi:hypothetical protein
MGPNMSIGGNGLALRGVMQWEGDIRAENIRIKHYRYSCLVRSIGLPTAVASDTPNAQLENAHQNVRRPIAE